MDAQFTRYLVLFYGIVHIMENLFKYQLIKKVIASFILLRILVVKIIIQLIEFNNINKILIIFAEIPQTCSKYV